jgi:hypothetical protein
VLALIQGHEYSDAEMKFTPSTYFYVLSALCSLGLVAYALLVAFRLQHLDPVTLAQSRPEILVKEGIIRYVNDYFSPLMNEQLCSAIKEETCLFDEDDEAQSIESFEQRQSQRLHASESKGDTEAVPPHTHLLPREGTWQSDFSKAQGMLLSLAWSASSSFGIIGFLPFIVDFDMAVSHKVKNLFWIDFASFCGTFMGRCFSAPLSKMRLVPLNVLSS